MPRHLPRTRFAAHLAADVRRGARVVADPFVVAAVLVDRRLVAARLLEVTGDDARTPRTTALNPGLRPRTATRCQLEGRCLSIKSRQNRFRSSLTFLGMALSKIVLDLNGASLAAAPRMSFH